ncbi:hypothetical protein HZQ52_14685 [Elizabethkingia anophelis]|uniref:hypothetical protein n=1 Tax=Flavobacterium lindanitolerans TaxID=428988 RepID=UPI0031D34CDB|nr:hypothetical protein [Elizabethkingia anophelis]
MTSEFIIISLQVLVGLLSAYLLYYAQQKGKNQADKEDLKKLTEIVEEVKKKNNEEIELLKANLSLFTDREKQIFGEEKQAIVEFFTQLNSWIWDSLNIHLSEFNHDNYQTISTRLIAMREAHNKTNISFSKVKLIVTDEDLINAGHNSIIKTVDLYYFENVLLKRLIDVLSKEKMLLDGILSKENNFEFLSDEIKTIYNDQVKQNKLEMEAIAYDYVTKYTGLFSPAMKEVNNFSDKAREYLREGK